MKKILSCISGVCALAVLGCSFYAGKADTFMKAVAVDNQTDAEWHHFEASNGKVSDYYIREYWVQCGGNYSFTQPDSSNIVECYHDYDTSGFEENDPRYVDYFRSTTVYYGLEDKLTYCLANNTYLDIDFDNQLFFSGLYANNLFDPNAYLTEDYVGKSFGAYVVFPNQITRHYNINVVSKLVIENTSITFTENNDGEITGEVTYSNNHPEIEAENYVYLTYTSGGHYYSCSQSQDGSYAKITSTNIDLPEDTSKVKTLIFGEGCSYVVKGYLDELSNVSKYIFKDNVEKMDFDCLKYATYPGSMSIVFEGEFPEIQEYGHPRLHSATQIRCDELLFNGYKPIFYLTSDAYDKNVKYGYLYGFRAYVIGDDPDDWQSNMSVSEYRQKSAVQADKILDKIVTGVNELELKSMLVPLHDSMIEYKAISDFTQELVKTDTTDADKFQTIYDWVTTNVDYDDDSKYYSVYQAFNEKKGVCCQYVSLLHDMLCSENIVSFYTQVYSTDFSTGNLVDLSLYDVINYDCSSSAYNHALLAVYINDDWFFCDPTWTACGITNRDNMTAEQVVEKGYTFKNINRVSTLPCELSDKYLYSGGPRLLSDGKLLLGGSGATINWAIDLATAKYEGRYYYEQNGYTFYYYGADKTPFDRLDSMRSVIESSDTTAFPAIYSASLLRYDLTFFLGFIYTQFGLSTASRYLADTNFYIGEDLCLYSTLSDGTLKFNGSIVETGNDLIIPATNNDKSITVYVTMTFTDLWRHNPKNIYVEEGVTTISKWMFAYTKNAGVEKIFLPSTITAIEEYSFSNCDADLYFKGSSDDIEVGYNAFWGRTSTETYYNYAWEMPVSD